METLDEYMQGWLENAEYLVAATSTETQLLWEKHHKRIKWEQISMGQHVCIGELEGFPVCVDFLGAILDGHLVVFYRAVSRMVDHTMVDNWVRDSFRTMTQYNGGRPHCDAMNFHQCLHWLEEDK
jgi:hypothetical protein